MKVQSPHATDLYERVEEVPDAVPLFDRALTDPVLLISLRSTAHELGYRLVRRHAYQLSVSS